MVTGPVHKGIINECRLCLYRSYRIYCRDYRRTSGDDAGNAGLACGLGYYATCRLSEVSTAITHTRLRTVIRILDHDLRTRFHIDNPKILVCGLNPHAGENGHLGREEIDIIEPVLEGLRNRA